MSFYLCFVGLDYGVINQQDCCFVVVMIDDFLDVFLRKLMFGCYSFRVGFFYVQFWLGEEVFNDEL